MVFGVETVLWPTNAKHVGKFCPGILKAAEWFMISWHVDEAKNSRQRYAPVMDDVQGKGKGRGSSKETTSEEYRKETADKVARFRVD